MCAVMFREMCIRDRIIRHAYLFFKSTKNDARPFKADNIIKLKKAGIGMIVYAFVEVIARKGRCV